jgi:predicted SprT family Zn-dependent metalloprotease
MLVIEEDDDNIKKAQGYLAEKSYRKIRVQDKEYRQVLETFTKVDEGLENTQNRKKNRKFKHYCPTCVCNKD